MRTISGLAPGASIPITVGTGGSGIGGAGLVVVEY
jgi:hypothetical protein